VEKPRTHQADGGLEDVSNLGPSTS